MVSPALGIVADVSRNLFYLGIIGTPVSFFTVSWWQYVAVATGIALIVWIVAKSRLS